jgi:cytochrome c551/c552
MKRTILATVLITGSLFFACSNDGNTGDNTTNEAGSETEATTNQSEVHGNEVKPGDVQLTTPLNAEWASAGKSIYDLKCQSCHKLTEDRVVGPGWKGVTQKREPHWIMNMITNVDVMLKKDPEAQKLLEQCLVRMPNQNVSKEDARKILEFMRQNDGVQ